MYTFKYSTDQGTCCFDNLYRTSNYSTRTN